MARDMERFARIHPMMKRQLCPFLLWMIKRHEAHGYQIIKLLAREGIKVGPNRLYPVLKGMLEEGLISQMEKREGRRVRKVYVITAKGRKALLEGKKMFTGLVGEFAKEMVS